LGLAESNCSVNMKLPQGSLANRNKQDVDELAEEPY
jgi:hypothetical protein